MDWKALFRNVFLILLMRQSYEQIQSCFTTAESDSSTVFFGQVSMNCCSRTPVTPQQSSYKRKQEKRTTLNNPYFCPIFGKKAKWITLGFIIDLIQICLAVLPMQLL